MTTNSHIDLELIQKVQEDTVSGISQIDIARKHGVCRHTVRMIQRGQHHLQLSHEKKIENARKPWKCPICERKIKLTYCVNCQIPMPKNA